MSPAAHWCPGIHPGRSPVVPARPLARKEPVPRDHAAGRNLLPPAEARAGPAIQRVHTKDGPLDETMALRDQKLRLVPHGHHPCGDVLYDPSVMAGPLRKWRYMPVPDHAWVPERHGQRSVPVPIAIPVSIGIPGSAVAVRATAPRGTPGLA